MINQQFQNHEDIKPRIRDILLYGVKNHPRAILQAISAFQSQWIVIKYRGLDQILYPEIIMILNLLPRNVFEAIFKCPHYFFYLHALATGKENDVCRQTQLEELYEMGVPENTILSQYHKLSGLLDIFSLPDTFNYDDLIRHLTIPPKPVSNKSEPVSKRIIDLVTTPTWEILNSNDPGRILQANSERGDEVLNLYTFQASSTLTEALDWNPVDNENQSVGSIDKIESAIIVAGLIGDSNADNLLNELLQNSRLPIKIQLRALYALSHHFNRNKNRTKESNVLINFAMNSKNYLHARICAIKLMRYSSLEVEQVKRILTLLEISAQKPGILSNKTLETVIEADWWKIALDIIDPDKFESSIIIKLCERSQRASPMESLGQWPMRKEIADYLIRLTLGNASYSERAFRLLRNHEDKLQSLKWLGELSIKCHQEKSKGMNNE